MKFELNEYHKNISTEDLIEDLCVVAKKLNKSYLSRTDYEKNGKYSATPYISNFGSWLAACERAGLKTIRNKEDFKRISDDELLKDMLMVSRRLNSKSISTKDYSDYGKYKVQTILSRFSNWSEALKKADLEQTGFKIISNKDLFDEIERIWIQKGNQPTTTDVKNGLSKYSLNTYSRRFGGWRATLLAFLEYINNDDNENVIQEESTEVDSHNKKQDLLKNVTEDITRRHKTSRHVNDRLRFKVLKRDNFKCCACGVSPAKDPSIELHVDHIIPWTKGGETVIENLQTLCSKCNLGKGDML
ncbi:HNH endonuclease [Eubacteriaceae bacterium ES2]|nr:HNH endonuclease [Eubacteriaceae bacterium ES2]